MAKNTVRHHATINAAMTNPDVKSKFFKCPNFVFVQPRLSPTERLLVIYILSFKVCYPSQSTMSAATGLSVPTIQRLLRKLVKENVISVIHRFNKSSQYAINNPDFWTLEIRRKRAPKKTSSTLHGNGLLR